MLKRLIFRAAQRAGVLSLAARSEWRRQRLLILCYHGVSLQDEHEWNRALYVSPALLRERLRWLRAGGYPILQLGDALTRLEAGTLPHKAVAITFDDGSYDFAERALPILREFDALATVYLTTYYCEHRYPVFDTTLSYLMWRGRRSGADLRSVARTDEGLPVAEPAQRARAWAAVQGRAKRERLGGEAKHALLGDVARQLGIDFSAFVASGLLQLMTPTQVRALPRDLVDVQLHTHRHRTPRERTAFIRELRDNQHAIEQLTTDSSARRHFCYPSGDYDEQFLPWLREFGVESATTGVPGLATPTADRLLLPRFIDSMNVSPATFAAWASGAAEFLPRRAEHRLQRRRPDGNRSRS
jgi:peptidoglycan/xylan/chitin deacetylase (PgdA/CDA1 family)